MPLYKRQLKILADGVELPSSHTLDLRGLGSGSVTSVDALTTVDFEVYRDKLIHGVDGSVIYVGDAELLMKV